MGSSAYLVPSEVRTAVIGRIEVRLQSDNMRTIVVIVIKFYARHFPTWRHFWMLTKCPIQLSKLDLLIKVGLSIHRRAIWSYRRFVNNGTLLYIKFIGLNVGQIRLTTIALTGLKRIDVVDDFVFRFDRMKRAAVDIHALSIRYELLGALVHVSYKG